MEQSSILNPIVKRGKGKHKATYTLSDIHKSYIAGLIDKDSQYNVKATLFNKICKDFNTLISSKVINEAFEFKYPNRLGTQRIKKNLISYRLDTEGKLIATYIPVDYKATNELWTKYPELKELKKKVYHQNQHTDGYKVKWYWCKKGSAVPNQYIYSFIPTRDLKRELARAIKTNPDLNYYE